MPTTTTTPADSEPDCLARLSPRIRAIIKGNTAALVARLPRLFAPQPEPIAGDSRPLPAGPRRLTATRPPAGRVRLVKPTSSSVTT